jgi:hypothetical protein
MVLVNAPSRARSRHRGIRLAIDMQAAVQLPARGCRRLRARFRRRHRNGAGDGRHARLSRTLDYTAIGNVVNLAHALPGGRRADPRWICCHQNVRTVSRGPIGKSPSRLRSISRFCRRPRREIRQPVIRSSHARAPAAAGCGGTALELAPTGPAEFAPQAWRTRESKAVPSVRAAVPLPRVP